MVWLNKSKRLSKDYEHLFASANFYIHLAIVNIFLKRLNNAILIFKQGMK
ncbi:MAG: hypothetical protein KC505_08185 [Myxococcales bacterium]|nr:hypothetical protein [Myxococcales bacterium]USN50727.1 MAG: hypothetical protein H6731_10795 [Myxococcales bacterium]